MLNSLLLANVMAEEGKPLGQLVADLQREFGPHHYGRRDMHIPDDIKVLAPFALAHRIIVSPSARIKDVDATSLIQEILGSVAVPGGSASVLNSLISWFLLPGA